jgi:hypothetical protein
MNEKDDPCKRQRLVMRDLMKEKGSRKEKKGEGIPGVQRMDNGKQKISGAVTRKSLFLIHYDTFLHLE